MRLAFTNLDVNLQKHSQPGTIIKIRWKVHVLLTYRGSLAAVLVLHLLRHSWRLIA